MRFRVSVATIREWMEENENLATRAPRDKAAFRRAYQDMLDDHPGEFIEDRDPGDEDR